MATLQAPVANYAYVVNGHSYTSGADGKMTVTDAGDIALLKAIGIREDAPMPIGLPGPVTGGGSLSITCDMG